MRIRTSEPGAGFAIDQSLGYLVNQLAKKLAASFNERLAEYGLTTTQWGVLACLWGEDGLSQRDLSRRTGTDPATLTEMLKRMEARGLVRRERDPDNNRLQRVYIAERDAALRDTLTAEASAVNRLATAGFSDDERAQLAELLRRALSNIAPETLPATATATATPDPVRSTS
jgi:DNA-binding MarR family transcriptional regulator